MEEFDFIGPNDRPALVAVSTPEWLESVKAALVEQGYKVHCIQGHDKFSSRFHQTNYQVVVIEDIFGGTPPDQNTSLQFLQRMPTAQRRHCAMLLLGSQFETLNALQAFA